MQLREKRAVNVDVKQPLYTIEWVVERRAVLHNTCWPTVTKTHKAQKQDALALATTLDPSVGVYRSSERLLHDEFA